MSCRTIFVICLLLFSLVASSILFSSPFCVTQMDCPVGPPKGGWGYLMSPTCLESQGCYLIPLSYFHSFPCLGVFLYLVLLLFLSCYFSASRKFSDIFKQEIGFFVWRLFRSWFVVCAACCHMALVFAIMHLY